MEHIYRGMSLSLFSNLVSYLPSCISRLLLLQRLLEGRKRETFLLDFTCDNEMATATWNDESSRGKRNRRKKWLWRLLLSLYYVYITNKFAHCLENLQKCLVFLQQQNYLRFSNIRIFMPTFQNMLHFL